jgi:hypothetical protein
MSWACGIGLQVHWAASWEPALVQGLHVLPKRLYGNRETSFFTHVRGSSWHGWDRRAAGRMADLASTLAEDPITLVVGLPLALGLVMACLARSLSPVRDRPWELVGPVAVGLGWLMGRRKARARAASYGPNRWAGGAVARRSTRSWTSMEPSGRGPILPMSAPSVKEP